MELATNEPILVTGGTGFLAGHLVQQLLVRGYRVRTTVRTISASSAVYNRFSAVPGVNERLEIVEADLTKDKGWENTCRGVEYIIHCACLPHEAGISTEDMCAVIIDGTKRLLDCAQRAAIKKFIHISCLSAVSDEFDTHEYSEDDWNETSSLDRNVHAYCKTAAERMVLDYANSADTKFSAVSIVPGLLWGPGMGSRQYSSAYRHLTVYLSGQLKLILNISHNISDVRDVAAAAVLALEQSRVSGRYLLTHKPLPLTDILISIHESFPELKMPTRRLADAMVRLSVMNDPKSFRSEFLRHAVGRMCNLRNTKAPSVGMIMRPPVQTIKDTVRYLLENDLLDADQVAARLEKGSSGSSCVIC